MWGKKDKSRMFAAGCTTLISKSTEIVGDIHFTGNLEIEGKVRGNVIARSGEEARVRVMEVGAIEGEIKAPTIVINGKVTGDVYSSKHIELAANASIQGNVHYNLIEMVTGAQVDGSLVHEVEDQPDNKPKLVKTEEVQASAS